MTSTEFGELFRLFYPRLYRRAYSLLSDPEDSRDVVSEVFAELLAKHIHADDIEAYLLAMVRNRACDVLRRRQVYDEVRVKLLSDYQPVVLYDNSSDEQIRDIRVFIDTELTPQTRRILQLCYDEKKSYKDVAAELGISVQAVNKHISQALRKLRERFNPSFLTTK